MTQITIDNVQPLVTKEAVDGRTIHFAFSCPVSGQTFNAQKTVTGTPTTTSLMAGRVKRSLVHSIRGPLSSAIRRAFGYNSAIGRMIGDVAGQVAYSAASGGNQGKINAVSKDERNEALVACFTDLASNFMWDDARGSWVAAETLKKISSPFEMQLREHALREEYDRVVAARMLVEVAHADGKLAAEERRQLAEFIDPALGTVEELAARPPLSDAELAETSSEGTRRTMLMLAWALALADEDFAPEEANRLADFARGLGLSDDDSVAAKLDAQGYLIEQAIARNQALGRTDAGAQDAVVRLGENIGMARGDVEGVIARHAKRSAIA